MTRKSGLFVIPPCAEAMEWTSKALDARLTLRQRILLRMHLRMCGACTEYHNHMGILHSIIARLFSQNGAAFESPFAELPVESKVRIKQAIEPHIH